MREQDSQPPLLASKCAPTYTHACIYHRHTHLTRKNTKKEKEKIQRHNVDEYCK